VALTDTPLVLAVMAQTVDTVSSFKCPITHEIFSEPVVASDGHTYEGFAIREWMMHSQSSSWRSPLSGVHCESRELRPNHALSQLMEEMASQASHCPRVTTMPAARHEIKYSELVAQQMHTGMIKISRHQVTLAPSLSLVLGVTIAYLCAIVPFIERLVTCGLASTPGASSVTFIDMLYIYALPLLFPTGSPHGLLFIFTAMCVAGAGLAIDDERIAVALVAMGAPLACVFFFIGLVCSQAGHTTSVILVSRLLLLAGFFFSGIGARFFRRKRRDVI
jgi:hypothetical protein